MSRENGVDLFEMGPSYLRGVITVESAHLVDAKRLLTVGGFVPKAIPSSQILDISPDDCYREQVDKPLGPIDDALGFLAIDGDPLDAAELFDEESQIRAAPIHAMGQAGHWKFMPGTEPVATDFELRGVPNAESGKWIGVVDSGIVEDTPDWLNNVLFDSPADVESFADDDEASHGTFVTGLIRQLAPQYEVSFTKARSVPPNYFISEDLVEADRFKRIADDQLARSEQFLTTELHVAEAISRLLAREHETVAALNLSLGAYAIDPSKDQVFLTLEKALQAWSDAYPKSPVFAAAGNEEDPGPFWPAALSAVRGVAAADLKGKEVVWDRDGKPVRPPNRPWVSDLAPGTDLVNQGHSNSVYVWSGSSFASAVATATHVGRNAAPKHADVSNLTFVSGKGDPADDVGQWTFTPP